MTMIWLLAIGGILIGAVVFTYWMNRYQRDIDDVEEREYRDPPAFLDGKY